MSRTSGRPVWKGSEASRTTVAWAVIQARPERRGLMPRRSSRTLLSLRTVPSKVVPTMDVWRSLSLTRSVPRAWRAAMTAQVPVPQGLRSSMPVKDSGRAQSQAPPLLMTTVFEATTTVVPSSCCSSVDGPRKTRISGPGSPVIGCVQSATSLVLHLIISPRRTISRPRSGSSFMRSDASTTAYVMPLPYTRSTTTDSTPAGGGSLTFKSSRST
mmetsp:Transcript_14242/g.43127  ORF Transcript_14242/g.43127 Transcript_14242/m.43127 type:complete len:214 (-) Transcript_14242:376-1017(-)